MSKPTEEQKPVEEEKPADVETQVKHEEQSLQAEETKPIAVKESAQASIQAAKIKPGNTEVTFQSGSIFYKMDDLKYIIFFDKLFKKVYSSKTIIPDKYYKAFIILGTYYFENSDYPKVVEFLEFLPENIRNYNLNLILAKTYFHLGNFIKSIDYFEKISLSNDDKYILCKAYIQNNMENKAKDTLWILSYDENFHLKIKNDKILEKIVLEIKEEKRRIEEQRIQEERKSTLEKEESFTNTNNSTKIEEKIYNEKTNNVNNEIIQKEKVEETEEKVGINEREKIESVEKVEEKIEIQDEKEVEETEEKVKIIEKEKEQDSNKMFKSE